MISIPEDFLRRVAVAAEAAYPRECCGLFAGTRDDIGDIAVTRIRASANMATNDPADRPDRFEIDPEIRFELMRDIGEFDRLDDTTGEHIVGHYHSHPDGPARPSAFDLEMAFEPDLFWLIIVVTDGRAAETTLHRLDPAAQAFKEIAFRAV